MSRVRGTCVAIGGRGVLLTGESGTGKSDLALRLIDRGAALVSDDYTELAVRGDMLLASPPPTIAGLLEVRGLGPLRLPHHAAIPLVLVVALGAGYDRMPENRDTVELEGIALPRIALDAFEASAPIKLEMALARVSA